MTDSKTADAPEAAVIFGWNKSELQALALALGVLVVWGGGFALFGFSALIITALLLVLGSFVALIMISRGD